MLVRNGRANFATPGKFSGFTWGETGNFVKGGLRNRFTGGVSDIFGGYPNGNLAPAAFILPTKPGSLSSYTLAETQLSTAAELIPAKNLVGSSGLQLVANTPQLDQIVSAVGSSALRLTTSSAILAAAAGATGSGTLTLTASNALCGAIFSVTAPATMTLTASSKFLTALAYMEASAGGPTELSPEGLALALLDDNEVENGFSVRNSMRLILSSAAGKLSGAPGSTVTIRNTADDKDRIVATVDANGNRTSITYDVSD